MLFSLNGKFTPLKYILVIGYWIIRRTFSVDLINRLCLITIYINNLIIGINIYDNFNLFLLPLHHFL